MKKIFLVIVILLAFLSFFQKGCGEQKAQKVPAASVPMATGESIFKLENDAETSIWLERNGNKFETSAGKGFNFFINDQIKNLSEADVVVKATANDFRFLLRPLAKMCFEEYAVTILEGNTRLAFNKVKGTYKIKIPGAILAIIGTKLDVLVNPDQSSTILVHEGKVVLIQGGKDTTINEGDKVTLGPNASSVIVSSPDKSSFNTYNPDKK
ncbi:MAG: hypothetical protein HQM08_15005 [Candidatus Riflebacteria bacterium]|nr:hypothetical protein [Candidatus Riflebacteria bacterium]